MLKVRYHLQKGEHYMHWQFKDTDSGEVWYAPPEKNFIRLTNCVLHNNPKLAEKIYMGKNKDVCAWIKCQNYEVLPSDFIIPSWCNHIRYNPKVLPYWHVVHGSPPVSMNLDGLAFDELILCNKGVFYNSCREGIICPFVV